jgi:hypothetical protein
MVTVSLSDRICDPFFKIETVQRFFVKVAKEVKLRETLKFKPVFKA